MCVHKTSRIHIDAQPCIIIFLEQTRRTFFLENPARFLQKFCKTLLLRNFILEFSLAIFFTKFTGMCRTSLQSFLRIHHRVPSGMSTGVFLEFGSNSSSSCQISHKECKGFFIQSGIPEETPEKILELQKTCRKYSCKELHEHSRKGHRVESHDEL